MGCASRCPRVKGTTSNPCSAARGAGAADLPPPWAGSIVAAVVAEGDAQAIALVDVDGDAPPRRLLGGIEQIGHLAWSPDGASLAFSGRLEGNWDLFRVARDGSALRRLTEDPAFDDWPAWSPDGRQLAFTSYRDGELAVFRTAPDEVADTGGSAPISAVRVSAGDGPALEPAWSPDGRWIVFAQWVEGAYHLMAAPAAGEHAGDASVVVQAPAAGSDLRAPAFAPGGGELTYLEHKYGAGQLSGGRGPRPW